MTRRHRRGPPRCRIGVNDPRDLELDAADTGSCGVTDTCGDRLVEVFRSTGAVQSHLSGTRKLNQPYGLPTTPRRLRRRHVQPAGRRPHQGRRAPIWDADHLLRTAFTGLVTWASAPTARSTSPTPTTTASRGSTAAPALPARLRLRQGPATATSSRPRSPSRRRTAACGSPTPLNYRLQHLTNTGAFLGPRPRSRRGGNASSARRTACSSTGRRSTCATRSTTGSSASMTARRPRLQLGLSGGGTKPPTAASTAPFDRGLRAGR